MSEQKPWEEFATTEASATEAKPWEEFAQEKKPWEEFAAQPKEERGEPIKDVEIAAIAQKHNISPEKLEYLRSFVEFRGGYTETPVDFAKAARQIGGFVSESLAYGAPQFAMKKAESDPAIRAAMDDLGDLVDERKTYARQAAEIGLGFLTGAGEVKLAAGAIKAGAKAAGKEVAEAAAERVAIPAVAAGVGATVGVAKSREGEELPGAAMGAAVGVALPYVLKGTVAGAKWIRSRAARESSEAAAKEVAEAPDLVAKIRPEVEKQSGLTEVVDDLIAKQTAAPGDATIARAINNVDELIPIVGEEKIVKAGRQILENLDTELRPKIQEELSFFDTEARRMARLVQLKLDETLPKFADEIGEKAGSAREALRVVASRAGEGAEFLSKRYRDGIEKDVHSNLVAQRLVERALANTAEGTVLQGLTRKISDYQFVIRQIDRLRGTRIEPILNMANEKYNAFTRHMAASAKDVEKLNNLVKSSGITQNELYNALDKPDIVKFGGQKGQVVEAYKSWFEKMRQEANAQGLNIAKRENYVPHFLKDQFEIARNVRDRVREIEQRFGVNLANYTQDQYADAVKKGMNESPLYRELKDGLDYLYGEKIGTPQLLQDFLSQQLNPRSAGVRSSSKAAATYRRTAENVPLFLRETDVGRLAVRWVSTTLKHAYLRNEFADVEKARDMLAKAGFKADSETLTNWLTDNLGGTRANTWRAATQEFSNTLMNMADKGGTKGRLANMLLEGGANNFMRFTGAVYPNFLGFNVRSALQNMTQPFLVTAPELGAVLGPRYILRTLPKLGNLKTLMQTAEQYRAAQWSTELQSILESGMKRSWIGEKSDKLIRQYTSLAMGIYEVAERANRAIVVNMGQELTKDILAKDKVALQYLSKLNVGARREIQDAIARGDTGAAEKLLINNLLDKTAFQYNRLSMSEFGRAMGPVMSTFSKWPTVLAGDIIESYERQGLGKGSLELSRKYLGPLVLLAAGNAVLTGGEAFKQEDVQTAALIGGQQGLTSLSPLMSLKQGIGMPPVLQSAKKLTEGALSGDMNKVVNGLSSVGDAYIPVIPSILRTINDVSKLTEGEEAEVKNLETLLESLAE